jgi:hypothetical protein
MRRTIPLFNSDAITMASLLWYRHTYKPKSDKRQ